MTKPNIAKWPTDADRRTIRSTGAHVVGVPCRDDDIEPTKGLNRIAILFRVMSGMLITLMVLQLVNGLTGTLEISYGVLFAEAIRLVIFAGLLWGAGDLADLFVKSHHDLRATRILTGRLTRIAAQLPESGEPRPGEGDQGRVRGDARH